MVSENLASEIGSDTTFVLFYVATVCGVGSVNNAETLKYLQALEKVVDKVYEDYKFFPMFLLIGYLGFAVAKWRDTMVNSHTIQGRIHDLGLIIGAWGTANPSIDLNGDGLVDSGDIGLLIGAWGVCP